ncbi:hypothetical protein E2C01_101801 [Portunus trituberculatus]|uniref:Uncharacterized protein n=1 Tax=Portunus trituberculatus TaxID=210409 RepID=A0A5B7K6K4_PORTR|nr:hypothetical protein [Portunus trituberculatus]
MTPQLIIRMTFENSPRYRRIQAIMGRGSEKVTHIGRVMGQEEWRKRNGAKSRVKPRGRGGV